MKKYLFSLEAMLVGAGLMFVLMHGEMSADNSNFTCSKGSIVKSGSLPIVITNICTGHGLKCVFSIRTGVYTPSGVSCVKTRMFK